MSNSKLRPETIAAQSATGIEPHSGAVSPPVYLTTTYARDENYQPRLKENYQRNGSPNLWALEETVARLEKGAAALAFASGMAAVVALTETIPQGGHVVAPAVMYYGVRAWLQELDRKGRISLTLCDPSNLEELSAAITPKTDLVWIETPVNPTWDVIDIAAAASAAHRVGAILAVDATSLGAVACNPLTLGADVIFHSATKYLNGHSDVLAGILVTREVNARWQEVQRLRTITGSPLPPFECWLLLRGLRTLFVRYNQATGNALAIARHFSNHPKIERVLYPGLATQNGHAIAKKQMTGGYGGMMSLQVKSDFNGAQRFCTLLKIIAPATSLGGVESLAEHRKTVEGPTSTLPDNLVRLSIGIENVNDLIADIEQALSGV
ncbi:trans-sulfuration enzyme family protein [Aestuariivirga litoralis]|uniref:trans-sulfuration enzyme family protein n=1 Tax=Aestuariivirga litoralis TaxID=2650924 RepID=UPI0018C47F43|nr:aminotransferase class I/II-fold pyridoxal phosphate-dependent enzyme [Aestuariivirga litoralis]MBG1233084.1 aminotransferase class I/II-fold pyridoxal phosphate-dependent enzyme [Aestuariivirga litoralis]